MESIVKILKNVYVLLTVHLDISVYRDAHSVSSWFYYTGLNTLFLLAHITLFPYRN